MRLTLLIRGVALRLLKFAMYTIWGLAGLCLLYYAAVSLYVRFVDLPGLDRFLADASAVNARGDRVIAETQRDSGAGFRAKTAIKLKRAHHWFSTTLVQAESENYLVGLKWRNQDTLMLQLDFGCNADMTAPVEKVGQITLVYRFGDPGAFPPHGYSFFPRDVPRKPC